MSIAGVIVSMTIGIAAQLLGSRLLLSRHVDGSVGNWHRLSRYA